MAAVQQQAETLPVDLVPNGKQQQNNNSNSVMRGKEDLHETQDSPQTAHLPSPHHATHDLGELVPYFQAHEKKLYYSGYVYKRNDLDSAGRRVVLKDGEQLWTPWWVELRGTALQFWSAEERSLADAASVIPSPEDVEGLKSRQEVPNFINISDACAGVASDGHSESPTSTLTPNSDTRTLTPASANPRRISVAPSNHIFTHSFNLTSAGCNLYTIACPSVHMRDAWLFAIRLAQFEYARLCEAYTARLLQRPDVTGSKWEEMGVDPTMFQSSVVRKPGQLIHQGWVLARVTYETEWRRFWCTVTAGDEHADDAEAVSPAPSPVPAETKSKGNALSRLFAKSPRPDAPKKEKVRSRVALYADKKDIKKKREPVLVVERCQSVYAIYPERPEMIMGTGSLKFEGDRIRVRWDLMHQPSANSKSARPPAVEPPPPTFVTLMLPTAQELAGYAIAACAIMSSAARGIREADEQVQDYILPDDLQDQDQASLWLSVPEVVSFLPLLRRLPIMPPKDEFLAMIAEKLRISDEGFEAEEQWSSAVAENWVDWLRIGIPAHRQDVALLRAPTAVLDSHLSPKSPGGFSFSMGPDLLSTMTSPVGTKVPEFPAPQSEDASVPLAKAAAFASPGVSEDDIPLALRAKSTTSPVKVQIEDVDPPSNGMKRSESASSLPSQTSQDSADESVDSQPPQTLHDLILKDQAQNGNAPALLSPHMHSSSMVLVAVPSPTVTESGEQVWDWEYQLVDRKQLESAAVSPIEPKTHAELEAEIPSVVEVQQQQQPVSNEKPAPLTVVIKPITDNKTDENPLSQPDTMVPSETSAVAPQQQPVEAEKPADETVASEVAMNGIDEQLNESQALMMEREDTVEEFHTPNDEPVKQEVAETAQEPVPMTAMDNSTVVNSSVVNPVPVEAAKTGVLQPEEDERPLAAQLTSLSLTMPIGPSDSASAVGQAAQMHFGANYGPYAQAFGQGASPMLPVDQFGMPMRGGFQQQMSFNGARSTIMPPANYGMPMQMVNAGAQSVAGYPAQQFAPGMFAVPDPYDFDDSASVRARNSLAMAWLEREREKERQRQHERQIEQSTAVPGVAPTIHPMQSMQSMQSMQIAAMQAAAMQAAFPPMASMPPVIPGSVVFIPGYGYVQQPQPQMMQQPMVQPAMWGAAGAGYAPSAIGAPSGMSMQTPMQTTLPRQMAPTTTSRPNSMAFSVRSTTTTTVPRQRVAKPRAPLAASVIGESDSDEDVPLNALGVSGKNGQSKKVADDAASIFSSRGNGTAQRGGSKTASAVSVPVSNAPAGLQVPVSAPPVGQAAHIPKETAPRPRTK